MSATIARLSASAIAKRCAAAATKPLVVMRAFGTTPLAASSTSRTREAREHDFFNRYNASSYEYHDCSSFESEQNVLEMMAQVEREQESTSYWEQAVRSAYKRRGISNPMVYYT